MHLLSFYVLINKWMNSNFVTITVRVECRPIVVVCSLYSELAMKLDAHVAACTYQRNAVTLRDLQSISRTV